MKIYYFLDEIENSDFTFFLDKIELIKKWMTPTEVIDRYFYKIWEDNRWRINSGYFFEAIIFIDAFSKKYFMKPQDILEHIVWVHNNLNFYVYNQSLYVAPHNTWKYEKIDLSRAIYFVTSRDSWLNPFFLVLYKLSTFYNNLIVIRPNKRAWRTHQDDKIFNMSKLYDKHKKLFGDVVIPYMTSRTIQSIGELLREVKKRLWNKVVLKMSASSFWQWVKMLKVSEYTTDEKLDYLRMKYFTNYSYSIQSLYFVPYYEIESEFRLYFSYEKDSQRTKIVAIKRRKNEVQGNVFEKPNFEIWKNVTVKWEHQDVDDFINNKDNFKFIDTIIQKLNYDRWVIEIIRDFSGNMMYSEINTLGGLILFTKDQEDMMQHWKGVWWSQLDMGLTETKK